jgi:RND superfamily putative drug exporter
MFHRLGLALYARARLVAVVSGLVLIVCAVFGVGVFSRLLSGGFNDPASDSSKAAVVLADKVNGQHDMVLLVHSRSGTVDQPAATASGEDLTTRLEHDPRLRGVTSYWTTHSPGLRSRDGTYALVVGGVVGTEQQASDNASALLSAYGKVSEPGVTVSVGGAQAAGTDIGTQVGKDLAVAESIAVPITLILLVLAFGSLVAALLPLVVGMVSIFATLAELDVLSHMTSVSVFAINLTTAMGLGLGIDYALLVVTRFREELSRGSDVRAAVARTMATAGRTIAFSALAVSAAMAAMLVFPVYFLKSFAYAGVGVTLVSAAAALLLLPALLSILGHRVNAGRVKGINPIRPVEAPFWSRVARGVMRRPVIAAVPVIAALVFLATPLFSVTFGAPDERVLPTSATSHQVGDVLRNDFTAAPTTVDVVLTPASLNDYAASVRRLPGVLRVDSATAGGVQHVAITTGDDPASSSAQDLVRQVRALPAPPGTTVLVGGATATLIDGKQAISQWLPLVGGLIAVTTFILLFLFTGSVVQPIRALFGNVLTLGATLGAMVWIFQDGHFASLLGFTPTPTNTAMPVLLFCIAFGLSMDYELFVMSRITELREGGATHTDAVVHGLARSGRLVSTLAALLAVSFFAFGTSQVSFIQFFGIGTGLAILLDATVVRGILVPAFMRIFGEASWYAPRALRRLHTTFGVRENDEPTPVAANPVVPV